MPSAEDRSSTAPKGSPPLGRGTAEGRDRPSPGYAAEDDAARRAILLDRRGSETWPVAGAEANHQGGGDYHSSCHPQSRGGVLARRAPVGNDRRQRGPDRVRILGGHRRFPLNELCRILEEQSDGQKKENEKIAHSCAIYSRVSSHKQAKRGDLERQVEKVSAHATKEGTIIYKIYK